MCIICVLEQLTGTKVDDDKSVVTHKTATPDQLRQFEEKQIIIGKDGEILAHANLRVM